MTQHGATPEATGSGAQVATTILGSSRRSWLCRIGLHRVPPIPEGTPGPQAIPYTCTRCGSERVYDYDPEAMH